MGVNPTRDDDHLDGQPPFSLSVLTHPLRNRQKSRLPRSLSRIITLVGIKYRLRTLPGAVRTDQAQVCPDRDKQSGRRCLFLRLLMSYLWLSTVEDDLKEVAGTDPVSIPIDAPPLVPHPHSPDIFNCRIERTRHALTKKNKIPGEIFTGRSQESTT